MVYTWDFHSILNMRQDTITERIISDIFGQFKFVIENMKNPLNGLYFHAIDTSKEAFWCDKVTGLSQHSWLRAIGWYTMALLDSLDQVDNKRS